MSDQERLDAARAFFDQVMIGRPAVSAEVRERQVRKLVRCLPPFTAVPLTLAPNVAP